MRRSLVLISIVALLLVSVTVARAQEIAFPAHDGDRVECNAYIEMPKGYVSGICVMVNDSGTVKGAIVNEFGITALDFTYNITDDKVRLESVVAMLDKWYIRNVLSKDIRELLLALREGRTAYNDEKYHITYTLTPMDRPQDDGTDDEETATDE